MAKKAKIEVSVEIFDATKAYVKFVEKGLAMGLRRGGIEMERDIKKSMKKGKVFKKTVKKKKVSRRSGAIHGSLLRESSDPGDPPAVQTGALRASIGSQVVYRAGGNTDQIVLRVGSENIKYAVWLEKGTSRGLDPRPFVGPESDTYKKFITGGELMKSVEAIWKKMLSKKKNLGKGKKV